MKTRIEHLFFLLTLIIALGLSAADPLSAQSVTTPLGHTFSTLYVFTDHADGDTPVSGLVLSGDTLYGTASEGGSGSYDRGSLFAVKTDGTASSILHTFSRFDESNPQGNLVLSSNILYGTTLLSAVGDGSVFAINTDGTGYTVLHRFFAFKEGYGPEAGLLLSGNKLYGTTYSGGSNDAGTVFSLNTDGSEFRTLHDFRGAVTDGAHPKGTLILAGSILYGTTFYGGSNDNGRCSG